MRDRGPGPTACKVTQPWLRRGTAPDPSLRCSHGWQEVNDAPARLTTDPSCKDEARVGQQGTLTRVWARRGTRPRAPRDRRYTWAYLFGAVCPERAVGAALVLPYADTAATGLHLAEIGRHVAPGAHAVVVLDGAGWHARRGPRRPREPRPVAAAALQPRVEPGREHLGVPAPEQAQPSRLAGLRGTSRPAATPGTGWRRRPTGSPRSPASEWAKLVTGPARWYKTLAARGRVTDGSRPSGPDAFGRGKFGAAAEGGAGCEIAAGWRPSPGKENRSADGPGWRTARSWPSAIP